MHIKICGITSPDLAYKAACAGAHFIGLICVPSSSRAIQPGLFQAVAEAARAGGAEPVAVFAESTAETMLRMCRTADISWVQLHGQLARAEQHLLPAALHRIYAYQGVLHLEDAAIPATLDPKRDYLLFDGMQGGSGRKLDWSQFSYAGDFPWFLSGGLNPNNVGEAIRSLHPTAVDVSSGVEKRLGEKDYSKIVEFIQAAGSSDG
jgi:phosphoribosylanthranilate isomerase